jgi:hypothetical protein
MTSLSATSGLYSVTLAQLAGNMIALEVEDGPQLIFDAGELREAVTRAPELPVRGQGRLAV